MASTFLTTLSNAFSWMKITEFQLQFHWNLSSRVQLTEIQIMAWRRPGDKPLPEPTMLRLVSNQTSLVFRSMVSNDIWIKNAITETYLKNITFPVRKRVCPKRLHGVCSMAAFSTGIRAWISNDTQWIKWDLIIHPPLKLGHEWVITSHSYMKVIYSSMLWS